MDGFLFALTFVSVLGCGMMAGVSFAFATGREVRYVQASPEQYASFLAEQDVPAEFASLMSHLFGEVLDGRNSHLTDGVRLALGREPQDITDYARDAAATGVWNG